MKLEEAIKYLKHYKSLYDSNNQLCTSQSIETILQEIEHLQKENEELWREYWKNNICVEDSQDLLKEE